VFLGLILFGAYIGFPAGKKKTRDRVPWYDMILAVLGLSVGLYIAVYYPKADCFLRSITPQRLVISVMAILLIFEAIRRT
jgi:TRAP-type uncharacterized transport system fused permease subunit